MHVHSVCKIMIKTLRKYVACAVTGYTYWHTLHTGTHHTLAHITQRHSSLRLHITQRHTLTQRHTSTHRHTYTVAHISHRGTHHIHTQATGAIYSYGVLAVKILYLMTNLTQSRRGILYALICHSTGTSVK